MLRVHAWNEVIVSLLIPPAGGLLRGTQLIGFHGDAQLVSISLAVPKSSVQQLFEGLGGGICCPKLNSADDFKLHLLFFLLHGNTSVTSCIP